jgi:hypothetical protein
VFDSVVFIIGDSNTKEILAQIIINITHPSNIPCLQRFAQNIRKLLFIENM